jgi:hypothetical protein
VSIDTKEDPDGPSIIRLSALALEEIQRELGDNRWGALYPSPTATEPVAYIVLASDFRLLSGIVKLAENRGMYEARANRPLRRALTVDEFKAATQNAKTKR